MLRIDNRTVTLSIRETLIKDTFEGLLIEGLSIPAAALKALRDANYRDPEFVAYLSDGTCHVVSGKVRIKAEWRTESTSEPLSADEMRQRLGLSS